MTCRRAKFLSAAILLPLALAAGCAETAERDVLFQTATLGALVEGVYDGNLAIGELKKHGDLGLGTFDALDGEMVMLDGRVYRVRADGKAEAVGDEETTPFATVTFFEADDINFVDAALDLVQLEFVIDRLAQDAAAAVAQDAAAARRALNAPVRRNMPLAVRITGTFKYVKTRSVPRQTKPYPRLAEVAAKQPTFEFQNVEGTLVGFRCPQYMKGLNFPGWHLHFLTADRTGGGHVLELVTEKVRFAIDYTPALRVALPKGGGFYEADLGGDKSADLERAEN